MPPKRKRLETEDISSDETTTGLKPQRRPDTGQLITEVMAKVVKLKANRDKTRNNISKSFTAYIANKKKEITEYYASEAEERAKEAKSLLVRYAQALEKRVSIEKSIEDVIATSRAELMDLATILEGMYSGREKQTQAALGSFASAKPGAGAGHGSGGGSDEINSGGALDSSSTVAIGKINKPGAATSDIDKDDVPGQGQQVRDFGW